MRRALVAVLAWSALVGDVHGEPADAADELSTFLRDVVSLAATFRQMLFTADAETPQVSEGTLLIKRPGRFRWDYEQPAPQVVVCDGEKIWMYDPDLEQVTVRPVDETLKGTPAMLLSGQATLEETFDVARTFTEDGLDWVDLRPREGSPEFVSLAIGLRDGTLRRMELLDSLGQVTRIELDDIVIDGPVADDRFDFVPPDGVDVIGVGDPL